MALKLAHIQQCRGRELGAHLSWRVPLFCGFALSQLPSQTTQPQNPLEPSRQLQESSCDLCSHTRKSKGGASPRFTWAGMWQPGPQLLHAKLGHFPERTQHTRSAPGSFSETSSPEGQGDPKEASWTLCRDSVQDALGQRRVLSPEKSKDPL